MSGETEISLMEAANQLSIICKKIDNAVEIDSSLTSNFNSTVLIFRKEIDNLIQEKDGLEAVMENIDNLITDFKKRKELIFNSIKIIEDKCLEVMKLEPKFEFNGNLGSLNIRKSHAVMIEDEKQIPPEFMCQKITMFPVKADISKAFKAGKIVPGAKFEEREHLMVTKNRAIANDKQAEKDHGKALEMINKYELLNSELEVRLAELNFKLGRKNETRTDHSQS